MRSLITFDCEGDTLIGSLDVADGMTGVLIVSGGSEIRSGAHRGMALLAASLAAKNIPAFRYDRRGVGDSGGRNVGFAGAAADLIAAVAAFRRHAPHVTRIVGFGNCDAATTLALFGQAAGIDAVVLANPWMAAQDDALPPAVAIRARYAQRLRDPGTWWRALSGGIDIGKAIRGLRKIAAAPSQPQQPVDHVIDAIRGWEANAHIVLARGDATAIAFVDAARQRRLDTGMTVLPTDSHSFARSGDAAALEAAILAGL